MNLKELNQLELNEIGEWPGPVKVAVVLVLCGLVGFAWYWFLTKDQLIPLVVSLGRAAQRFEMGQTGDAAALLTYFGDQLGTLVDQGALPFYVGEASLARALSLIDDSEPQN